MASTDAATSRCTANWSRVWISISTSKVGGDRRSRTVFCVPRRRASSSDKVTDSMPPIKSERVGLSMRFSRLLPWAVPISCTPRSAMVRAAMASSSRPISSMTITSGLWFSTASIITSCWRDGVATCIRRARPTAGCGTSPSPPISFEVSTMTTRLFSARMRAASRNKVVLPTPGRPSKSKLLPSSIKSWMMSMVPYTARPTRKVSPTTSPRRLRIPEMRCRVRSMPARLSSSKSPRRSTTYWISSWVTSRSTSTTSSVVKREVGTRPKSKMTSSRSLLLLRSRTADSISWGNTDSRASRSSVIWRLVISNPFGFARLRERRMDWGGRFGAAIGHRDAASLFRFERQGSALGHHGL